MKILIIGATGATGRQLVEQSTALGHQVTAAVRRPETAGLPANTQTVRADVTDAASLANAVAGQEVVISSLGSKMSRQPTTLLSDGTRKLIDVMTKAAVRRFICITGVGAGDSKGHGGFLYDKILSPLLLSEVYKDKNRQEEIVRASGLDWMLIRPAMLTNGKKTGQYRALTNLSGVTMGKISRADVAHFILDHLTDQQSTGATYNLTY